MDQFNEMQALKRRFFAMRNGVIADTMRKAGSPFKIVFGLVVPQIEEIAKEFGYNPSLSQELWNNRSTRESMLIAPMLLDPSKASAEEVIEMARTAPSTEIADNLVHKLMRKMPDSFQLAKTLAAEPDEICRYCAMRLLWHHLSKNMEEVKQMAELELSRESRLTQLPARQIIEEVEFLME